MINVRKAFKFGRPFFQRVGKSVMQRHKDNIFEKGVNAAGKPFAKYTEAYRKRKVKAGHSGKVNLTLSGDMKKAFNFMKSSNKGFRYGITDPKMAERMEFQGPRKKKKIRQRFVSTKTNPTTPDLQEFIAQEMRNEVIVNFQKEIKKNGMGYKVYTI